MPAYEHFRRFCKLSGFVHWPGRPIEFVDHPSSPSRRREQILLYASIGLAPLAERCGHSIHSKHRSSLLWDENILLQSIYSERCPVGSLFRGFVDFGLAQSLPPPRQGLREPQSQRAGIPPPCINPPHAAKALQSHIDFPDRLLEFHLSAHNGHAASLDCCQYRTFRRLARRGDDLTGPPHFHALENLVGQIAAFTRRE